MMSRDTLCAMGVDVGYAVAFGGGVISFLSPCVLPLVPAYLSVVSGLEASDIAAGGTRQLTRVSASTLLFIAGFTVVFTLFGLSASAIGQTLVHHKVVIDQISGTVLIVMAIFLVVAQNSSLSLFYREKRFHPNLSRFGIFAAPVAGMAFAFGWTPCIGPILGSVFAVAATQSKLAQGAALLATYSLGLGVPFLITGLLLTRAVSVFAVVKRHFALLTNLSALVLVVFGVLLISNDFTWVLVHLQELASRLGLSALNRL
ncbi:MAG: cytochrome c biogenesis CcdA family protein [Ferrimicrobium sp.]